MLIFEQRSNPSIFQCLVEKTIQNIMDIEWENECKRCGIGCTHDYCHDCQMLGYDPSLSNHKNSENIDTSINKNTISNGGCVVPLRKECGVGVKKNKVTTIVKVPDP